MIRWRAADNEETQAEGVKFLCKHGENLGVPYKWGTVMSSLACSLNQDGFLIGLDDSGQVGGTLAYTFGTGEDDYNDRSRIEVHLLYIEEVRRCGMALAEAMHAFSLHVLELPQKIREIGFYGPPTHSYRRLFGKFATIGSTRMHPCGLLDFYIVTPESLRLYGVRRMSRKKPRDE